MAIALVAGGTVVTGTNSVHPAFAQATVAGHLLTAFVASTTPTNVTCNDPTWTVVPGSQMLIWYKSNCLANETAPTWSSPATSTLAAGLVEHTAGTFFSSGVVAASTSPQTATNSATDTSSGGLFIAIGETQESKAGTSTEALTLTVPGGVGVGGTNIAANNGATSSSLHYYMAWLYTGTGTPTGANNAAYSNNSMNISSVQVVCASFSGGPPTDVGAIAMSGTAGLAVSGALPIADLTEAFTTAGTPDTTKWTASDANVTNAGGQLQITCPSGTTTYHQLYSTYASYAYNYWNLVGSSVMVQLVNAGNQGLASLECYPLYLSDETYTSTSTRNSLFFVVSAGNLTCFKRIAGTQTQVATAVYNATNHAWVRIRELSGTTYFEVSPNGNTWNAFGSTANIPNTNQMGLWIQAGTYNSEASSTTCLFDNLNLSPPISVGLSGSSGLNVVGAAGSVIGLQASSSLVTQPIMGKLQFFTENFAGAGPTNPPWQQYGSGPATLSYVGGQLQMTLPANTASSNTSLGSVYQYDLTSSFCLVNVTNAGTQNAQLEVWAPQLQNPSGAWYGWHITNGTLQIDNWGTIVASTAYSPTTHAWLKMRESGGTTYYDYSADGHTWTNFGSHANQGVVNGVKASLYTGTNPTGTGPASTVTMDAWNLPPPVTATAFGPVGANLLTGDTSDFEASVGGWVAGGSTSIATTTAQANTGTHSLQITATAAANANASPAMVTGITGGQFYTVNGWFRAAATSRNCQFAIAFYDANTNYVGNLYSPNVADTTTGWTQATVTMQAPNNATKAYVQAWVNSAALNEVHYLDTVVLQQAAGTGSTLAIGSSVSELATVSESATAGMTVTATLTRLSSVTLAGGAALNISSALVTEIASVSESATAGMTVGGAAVTEVASVSMSGTSTLLASLAWTATLTATTSMTVVGTQITGRRYNLLPSRIYIAGQAGAISMFVNTGMTVGASLLIASSVAESATAGLSLGLPIMIATQKMATLTDNFNTAGTPDATKWIVAQNTGGVTNSGGQLVMTLPPNFTAWNRLISGNAAGEVYYDLTESYAIVQMTSGGNQAIPSWEISPIWLTDADTQPVSQGHQVTWYLNAGTLTASWQNQSNNTNGGTSTTYNATNHKWLRIREHAGTTYWDYSADGLIWTNLYSAPDIPGITYLAAWIQADTWNQETLSTTATFDNFNLPPAVAGAFSATAGMTVGSAAVTEVASVAQSATTSMSVAASVKQLAGVTLAGGAALNISSALVTEIASVGMSGTAGMTVSTGVVTEVASVSMSAATVLTATGLRTQLATVSLAPVTTLTVGSLVTEVSSVALAGTAGMTVTGTWVQQAGIAMSGTSGLTASAQAQQYAAVSMAGTGNLIASLAGFTGASVALGPVNGNLSIGTYLVTEVASVTFSGTASLTPAAQVQQNASVSQSGTASLTVTGTRIVPSAMTMASTAAMTVVGVETYIFTVSMAGTAGMTVASSLVTEVATVAMSAQSGLFASIVPVWFGIANLVGTTNMVIGSAVTEVAAVALSGSGVLTVTGTRVQFSPVPLSGTAGLTITASVQQVAAVGLVGTTSMAIAGMTAEQASVSFSASTVLTVAATVKEISSVAFSASTSLNIVASTQLVATVTMLPTASLALTPLVTEVASVAMAVTAHLTVVPQVYGYATLSGTSILTVAGSVKELAAFAGVGTASLSVVGSVAELASVNLVGVSGFTATALRTVVATVSLSGNGVLTAAASVTEISTVSLAVTASLTMTYQALGVVSMAALAGLTMVAKTWSIIQGQVNMSAVASMHVVPQVVATLYMTGVTSLMIQAHMIIGVAPGFSANTNMQIDVRVTETARVAMSARASLFVQAEVRRKSPTLFDQIQALEGQDPLLVGATGYMDDVFTTRLVSDSE